MENELSGTGAVASNALLECMKVYLTNLNIEPADKASQLYLLAMKAEKGVASLETRRQIHDEVAGNWRDTIADETKQRSVKKLSAEVIAKAKDARTNPEHTETPGNDPPSDDVCSTL